jgi:Ca2+-binding EF-hand superfamily protein
MEQLQEHMQEFDMEDTGMVDFPEFLKIMRLYREQEATSVRKRFKEKDTDGSGTLSESELKMVFLFLGHSPSASELKTLYHELCGDGEMDLWQLDTLVRRYRKQARQKFRENQGFTEREVRNLKTKFKEYEPDKNFCLEKRHLASLMLDLFPESDRSADIHAKAAEILKQVDEDGDGILDFNEFLGLMRVLQDESDTIKLAKEKSAVQATGFQREEVAEFRKIFQMFEHDASGEMSFEEFTILIGSLVPVGGNTDAKRELQGMLKEIDKDGNRSLDFPEFLSIMRKVQDNNLGGINEAAADTQETDFNQTTTAQSPSGKELEEELRALEESEEAEKEQEEEDDLFAELQHLMVDRLQLYAKLYGAKKAEMKDAEAERDARGAYVDLILSKRRDIKCFSVDELKERLKYLGVAQAELDKAADVLDEEKALKKLVFETINASFKAMDEEDESAPTAEKPKSATPKQSPLPSRSTTPPEKPEKR